MAAAADPTKGPRVPELARGTDLREWERSIRIWRMSTPVPRNRQAATIALEAIKDHRKELAFPWLESHEAVAVTDQGLGQMVAYLRQKSEGIQRDVRMQDLFDVLRYRRAEGQEVQDYLNRFIDKVARLRNSCGTEVSICGQLMIHARVRRSRLKSISRSLGTRR
jgi:hypothetical protein